MRSIHFAAFVALVGCAAAGTYGDEPSSPAGAPPVAADAATDGGATGDAPAPDAAACPPASASGPGIAATDRGTVQGALEGGSYAWKGVPYAAPPVGARRFRPAENVACYAGVLDATRFGSCCAQVDRSTDAVTGSEDCLTLNVWAPAKAATTALPVMVFIHGGGNTGGCSSETTKTGQVLYDGSYLAEHGNVVVVTMNYRLGPLGFLATSALSGERPEHASGNYGLTDQHAALEWVSRNARAFGGDPTRVTLFGESAGALDTCLHVVSPSSAGLFGGAILESGSCLGVATPLAQAEAAGETVVDALGCKGASDVPACMRAVVATDVVAAVPGHLGLGVDAGFHYGPVVDGAFLPDTPMNLVHAGRHNHVPLVVGVNANETSTLLAAFGVYMPTAYAYDQAITSWLTDAGAPSAVVGAVLGKYPPLPTPQRAYVDVTTDADFLCAARQMARVISANQSQPIFRYLFTHARDQSSLAVLGAGHGMELPFVFHTLDADATPAEGALSDAIIASFAAFARSRNPSAPGGVAWPPYAASDPYVDLDEQTSTGAGVRTAQCDFWRGLGYFAE